MADEHNDPFLNWINRWKIRMEQAAFFLFFFLHLILIIIVSVLLLVGHIYQLKHDLQHPPTPTPSNTVDH